MTSPSPLPRQTIGGGARSASGSKIPRLGLAIPPSTRQRPVLVVDAQQQPSHGSSINTSQPQLLSSSYSNTGSSSIGLSTLSSLHTFQSGSVQESTASTSQSSSWGLFSSYSTSGSVGHDTGQSGDSPVLDVDELDDFSWKKAGQENRIIELGSLGEGAGGAVTRCILKGGKTVFALKVITTSPDQNVKKQIVRELNFNKQCASDDICRYYGAFADDSSGTVSIAMEFCEGGSLDSIYREVRRLGGRTGEKVLGKIATGVLKGLTYLHKNRIMHRDIKPSNILLCRDGQTKLCDFGVSGEFGTKGDADTFIGTSYYMAPERITGKSYTITSDVWSTGITLLEVAQNKFPFPIEGSEIQPRAGLIDLLTYIVRQPVPELRDEPQNEIYWSSGFKYFIECCLERDPARRATPWRMLEHPWILEIATKKVNMERFLRQVWNWQD